MRKKNQRQKEKEHAAFVESEAARKRRSAKRWGLSIVVLGCLVMIQTFAARIPLGEYQSGGRGGPSTGYVRLLVGVTAIALGVYVYRKNRAELPNPSSRPAGASGPRG